MTSGPMALAAIDQALQESRTDLQGLDSRIRGADDELVQIRQEKLEQFAAFAKVRLGQIERGEPLASIDDADRRAKELLEERARRLDELERQTAECHARQTQLETERTQHGRNVEAAEAGLDSAEAATQARLAVDTAYQGQLAKAHGADDIAKQAEEKTGRAEKDRAAKGKPYEADPLFIYLWKRGYGTSKYSAGPLARALDGWVARLCGYTDARPNYWMLGEIPARLAEHAKGARAEADAEFAMLKRLEEQAAAADGVPARRAALEAARKTAAEMDAAIAVEETRYRDLMNTKSAVAAGQDEITRRGIEVLAAQMQREELVQLRREAEASPSAEDNTIVQRLADLEQRESALEQAMEQARQAKDARMRKLDELEETRRQFKQRRYDDPSSTFSNGGMISVLLGEFLRGMASSGDLWRTIERQQRRQPRQSNPDFGSGGFGFPGGGTWHMPTPSAPPPTSDTGGGGGGFSTGGGF
jgi:hypothetical protein